MSVTLWYHCVTCGDWLHRRNATLTYKGIVCKKCLIELRLGHKLKYCCSNCKQTIDNPSFYGIYNKMPLCKDCYLKKIGGIKHNKSNNPSKNTNSSNAGNVPNVDIHINTPTL